MGKFTRLAVLVAASMSLLAVLSSSAGAVTWHNTGDTAFTASSTSAETLSVTGVNLTCTGADATGTSPSGSVAGATYTLATGSASFTGCSLSGLPTTVICAAGFTTSTAPIGLVFSGTADERCSVTQFGTEICKIEGQRPASYSNPTTTTLGQFILAHASSERTTNGSGGTCPLGVGFPVTTTTRTLMLTNAIGGATTPHHGPKITRTA